MSAGTPACGKAPAAESSAEPSAAKFSMKSSPAEAAAASVSEVVEGLRRGGAKVVDGRFSAEVEAR